MVRACCLVRSVWEQVSTKGIMQFESFASESKEVALFKLHKVSECGR